MKGFEIGMEQIVKMKSFAGYPGVYSYAFSVNVLGVIISYTTGFYGQIRERVVIGDKVVMDRELDCEVAQTKEAFFAFLKKRAES